MEYVKGGELFNKLTKGRLKEEYARKYFQQFISAIDYCHSRGVSHRDLKPENLLLDENENLKVSDFGLSAFSPEHLRQDGLLLTQCGTPAYVAPEVLRKKGYDGSKADLWSCGVILFVLLSGFLPFQDVNMMKMYLKIFKAEYEYPPWFPQEAKMLVSKLLVVDPNKRLSIQGIMKQSWFRKEELIPASGPELDPEPNNNTPRFYNAFEFISSGLDLSSLFGINERSRSLFSCKCCGSVIMDRIETLAKKLKFEVSSCSNKDFKMKMQKGRLLVMAEVFEVAVVEFSKSSGSGDTLEYVKFCDKDVRPALKDIVWS